MDELVHYETTTSLTIFSEGERYMANGYYNAYLLVILFLWMVLMFCLSPYSKTLSAKRIAMGSDEKGTNLLSGVMKVWRGASLQSVTHPENGNSRKILAL